MGHSTPNDTTPAHFARPKQKRTRLSLREKIEIANLTRTGTHATAVMAKFNISRRTVTSISSNLGALVKRANENHISFNTKTVRDAAFPKMELLLIDFIAFARSAKMPVTQAIIQTRAIRFGFGEIGKLAHECNVQEASSLLRRAKKAFLNARAQGGRSRERQTVLGDYL